MRKITQEKPKKKLNILSLISLLIFPVLIAMLLIPWYRLFLLRDEVLSTLFIKIISMAIAGILMFVLGLLGILKASKQKGIWVGTWMGIVGLIIGVINLGISTFIIIDYLVTVGLLLNWQLLNII